MDTKTTLLIAGAVVVGAIVWKRFGAAKARVEAQVASATAGANRVADAINSANQSVKPLTGALAQALGTLPDLFSAIGGSNQQKNPYSGPGGGAFI